MTDCRICTFGSVCKIKDFLGTVPPGIRLEVKSCENYQAVCGGSARGSTPGNEQPSRPERTMSLGELSDYIHRHNEEDRRLLKKEKEDFARVVRADYGRSCSICGRNNIQLLNCDICGNLVCQDCSVESFDGKLYCSACEDEAPSLGMEL